MHVPAQIDLVKPHTLRRTFASWYLEADPDGLRGLARHGWPFKRHRATRMDFQTVSSSSDCKPSPR